MHGTCKHGRSISGQQRRASNSLIQGSCLHPSNEVPASRAARKLPKSGCGKPPMLSNPLELSVKCGIIQTLRRQYKRHSQWRQTSTNVPCSRFNDPCVLSTSSQCHSQHMHPLEVLSACFNQPWKFPKWGDFQIIHCCCGFFMNPSSYWGYTIWFLVGLMLPMHQNILVKPQGPRLVPSLHGCFLSLCIAVTGRGCGTRSGGECVANRATTEWRYKYNYMYIYVYAYSCALLCSVRVYIYI